MDVNEYVLYLQIRINTDDMFVKYESALFKYYRQCVANSMDSFIK